MVFFTSILVAQCRVGLPAYCVLFYGDGEEGRGCAVVAGHDDERVDAALRFFPLFFLVAGICRSVVEEFEDVFLEEVRLDRHRPDVPLFRLTGESLRLYFCGHPLGRDVRVEVWARNLLESAGGSYRLALLAKRVSI